MPPRTYHTTLISQWARASNVMRSSGLSRSFAPELLLPTRCAVDSKKVIIPRRSLTADNPAFSTTVCPSQGPRTISRHSFRYPRTCARLGAERQEIRPYQVSLSLSGRVHTLWHCTWDRACTCGDATVLRRCMGENWKWRHQL